MPERTEDLSMELVPGDKNLQEIETFELLSRRARELAVALEEEEERGESRLEVLEFLLSGERYAISMAYVKEVALLKEITQLPGTPPFILGIINLRGIIISLVDLRTILGLPPKGLTDYNRVIILHEGKMSFGILADSIVMTRTIRMGEISRPPPTISGVGAAYLIGILPGPLIVIDAHSMLKDPGMIVGDD
ncbi:MAG: chemotaxis protein CheW [Methanobacteriota archaeon]